MVFDRKPLRGVLIMRSYTICMYMYIYIGALIMGGDFVFAFFFCLFFGGGPCFSAFLGTGGMDMGLGLRPRARGGDLRAGAGIPTRIYTSVHLQLLCIYIYYIYRYTYIQIYTCLQIFLYTYLHIYIYT